MFFGSTFILLINNGVPIGASIFVVYRDVLRNKDRQAHWRNKDSKLTLIHPKALIKIHRFYMQLMPFLVMLSSEM